jgi:hypothetical protein
MKEFVKRRNTDKVARCEGWGVNCANIDIILSVIRIERGGTLCLPDRTNKIQTSFQ